METNDCATQDTAPAVSKKDGKHYFSPKKHPGQLISMGDRRRQPTRTGFYTSATNAVCIVKNKINSTENKVERTKLDSFSIENSSNSNIVIADTTLVLSEPDVIIPQSNTVCSVTNIAMPDKNVVIPESNMGLPDSDSISHFSVDSVNCESLEIASTCSIPDMSEYLPCEEVVSFQSAIDTDHDIIVKTHASQNEVLCRDFSEADCLNSGQKEKNLTHIEITHFVQTESEITQGNDLLNNGCDVQRPEFDSLSYADTQAQSDNSARIQEPKLVESNGKQYLKYHNPSEHVNILIPVTTDHHGNSERDVDQFISMHTDISTGSNVEVSTASCDTSIKKVEKRERDRIYKRWLRQDPQYRAIGREKTKAVMKKKRADESFRSAEREKDRLRRAQARKTKKELREKEKARDRKYHYYRRMQKNIGGQIHVLPVMADQEEVICTIADDVTDNIDEVNM